MQATPTTAAITIPTIRLTVNSFPAIEGTKAAIALLTEPAMLFA